MRLSTRSTYGMRALVELALASARGPVSVSDIALRLSLSVAYLEQLFHRLKKAGLLTSIRGPRGGYLLAKAPHQVTMAEVVRILDGNGTDGWFGAGETSPTLRHANRLSGKMGVQKDPHRHAKRIASAVWRCVHERLTQSLGAVSLEDLCDEVRLLDGEPLDHRYVFHI